MFNFVKKLNPLLAYHNLIQGDKTRYPTILLTALYLFSPIDISPDILPIVGWVDDGILLLIFLIEIGLLIFKKPKNLNSEQKPKLEVIDAEVINSQNSGTVRNPNPNSNLNSNHSPKS